MSEAGASAPAIPGCRTSWRSGARRPRPPTAGPMPPGAASSSRSSSARPRPRCGSRFDYDQARLAELREHPDIVVTSAHGYTDANQPYLVMEELSAAARSPIGSAPAWTARASSPSASSSPAPSRAPTAATSSTATSAPRTCSSPTTASPTSPTSASRSSPASAPTVPPTPARIAHAAPEQLADPRAHAARPTSTPSARCSTPCSPVSPAFVRPGDTVALRRRRCASRASRRPTCGRRRARPRRSTSSRGPWPRNPAERWESAEAFGHALQQAEVTLGPAHHPHDRPRHRPHAARPGRRGRRRGARGRRPCAGRGEEEAVAVCSSCGALVLVAAGRRRRVLRCSAAATTRRRRRRRDPARHPGRGRVDLARSPTTPAPSPWDAIERWDDVDGAPPAFDDGVNTPDVVAAEDAADFLGAGGLRPSPGIEVTLLGSPPWRPWPSTPPTPTPSSTTAPSPSRASPPSATPTLRARRARGRRLRRGCCSASRAATAARSWSSPASTATARGSWSRPTSSTPRTRRRSRHVLDSIEIG